MELVSICASEFYQPIRVQDTEYCNRLITKLRYVLECSNCMLRSWEVHLPGILPPVASRVVTEDIVIINSFIVSSCINKQTITNQILREIHYQKQTPCCLWLLMLITLQEQAEMQHISIQNLHIFQLKKDILLALALRLQVVSNRKN